MEALDQWCRELEAAVRLRREQSSAEKRRREHRRQQEASVLDGLDKLDYDAVLRKSQHLDWALLVWKDLSLTPSPKTPSNAPLLRPLAL